jgi:MFS family permease
MSWIDGGAPVSDETRAADRPATFRDVFQCRDYRALLSVTLLSWFGDYLAKAAITALVFHETRSVGLSALAFALSYLPWLAGGPVLAALAERRAFRPVMITCDVLRAAMMLLVAIPWMPLPLLFALLFLAALATPPFQAARSAMLPQILTGDRYVLGLSVQTSGGQGAQFAGYLVGAAMAPFYPRLALVVNAATFVISAAVLKFGISDYRPIGVPAERQRLARETADGFRMVFGNRILRVIAIAVFSSMLFAIVPEGLAAAWAADLAKADATRGWIQGMIMIAEPAGFITGGLIVARLVRPELRRRLTPIFMVLAPLALAPALFGPGAVVIALLAFCCGFAIAGLLPPASGMFVQSLPAGSRARAFGVMQGGMQITQGIAALATGALASRFDIPAVVGLWSLAGVVVLLIVALRWPSAESFAQAAAEARATEEAPTDDSGATKVSSPGGRRPGPVQAPV